MWLCNIELNSACWNYFLAKWLWYRLYIFLQSDLFSIQLLCLISQFSLFCMKGRLGRMTSSISAVTVRISNLCFHCSISVPRLSDLSKCGAPFCYLSPFFQHDWLKPNVQFTPSVSLAQLGRCCVNLWRGPVDIAHFIDFICKTAVKAFSLTTLCGPWESMLDSDVCSPETCKWKWFSLSFMKGQCLSEYVYKSSVEKRNCCCCMYVTFGHCISVHCLFVEIIPVCALLPIFCVFPCTKYWI